MKSKARTRKVPTRFEPETRFEVKPVSAAPFRAEQETEFEGLKARLLAARLEEVWEPEFIAHMRRAANEAAALAWATPFPLLFFPGLFEEKADMAIRFAQRQTLVRERSREFSAV
jgi:hypothetical protein